MLMEENVLKECSYCNPSSFFICIPCVYVPPLSQHERQHIMRVSMTCILVQPRYLSLSLVFQLREIVLTLFPVSHFTKFAQCCYRQLQATVWRKLLGYVGD
ncbi:hypothetical protein XENORESO_000379 [Xenotaenia resolanae]|uniref:Uncharacterized protein n=1 Tax=Xenotaenia resolanae TaxID=208358 RepID=A0ABV0X1Z4_9TELE